MPKSKSDNWITPGVVFDIIEKYFRAPYCKLFDPCPLNSTFNGLTINWRDFSFVNPPYTLLSEFVDKAIQEHNKGKIIIMLLPSKTDQAWFHKLIECKHSILWFKGRLKFANAKYHATQPHFLILLES